jgi:uncharacterized protein (TIGR02266 family)
MFQISSHESFEDGQVIFEEDSFGDWIYVIEYGAVELSKTVGGARMVLDVLQPGDIFGEIGYITKTERSATATAVGKTDVGIIDRSFLDDEFNKLSGRFRTILKELAIRLKRTSEKLAQEKLRREEPRFERSFSLTFKDRKSLVRASSENVSGLGIFIKTPKPLEKGTHFNLNLQLPGESKPLKIGCEVAWSCESAGNPAGRPVGMGVKFIQISKADKERLKAALQGSP